MHSTHTPPQYCTKPRNGDLHPQKLKAKYVGELRLRNGMEPQKFLGLLYHLIPLNYKVASLLFLVLCPPTER